LKKIRFGINPLAFFAGITLIISMLFPWWTLEVSVMPRPTDIYPYLVDGPASEIIGYQRSPQMTVLFILLLVCIALFLIGSFVKGKAITISNTTAGVLVILAVWRFLIRIGGVADLYEVPIQGHGIGNYGGFCICRCLHDHSTRNYFGNHCCSGRRISRIFSTKNYQINLV